MLLQLLVIDGRSKTADKRGGHMKTKLSAIILLGVGLIASANVADARSHWNRTGKCYPPLEGAATGKGILGLGSERAREAARDNWEASAEDRYGRAFANLSRARDVQWDCAKGALITAKCVVTASPCAARISG
jgi:hypothetical protein